MNLSTSLQLRNFHAQPLSFRAFKSVWDQRGQNQMCLLNLLLMYGNNTSGLSNSAILLVVVDHLCMINSRRHFAQNIGPWCKKYMPSRPNDNRHKSWSKLVIAWRTNLHGSNKWQPYHCSECTLGLVSCYTIWLGFWVINLAHTNRRREWGWKACTVHKLMQ